MKGVEIEITETEFQLTKMHKIIMKHTENIILPILTIVDGAAEPVEECIFNTPPQVKD